jgi:hypothetical protein
MRVLAILMLTTTGLSITAAQTLALRPGRYETTTSIEMPAMKMPPEKKVECITAEDLKDVKTFVDSELAQDCKVSDAKAAGSELTFLAACDAGGAPLLMQMKMTFTADSFTGLMTATEKGKPVMTVRSAGKRIGECAK